MVSSHDAPAASGGHGVTMDMDVKNAAKSADKRVSCNFNGRRRRYTVSRRI